MDQDLQRRLGAGGRVQSNDGPTLDYDYDAAGRLTQVTKGASITTSMTHDLSGRKIEMDDADMGTWPWQQEVFDTPAVRSA